MATLNTLRTRGGIVVSIVIGIALLAFLLGDFGNQGASAFQERKMRVGEINGEKIGYTQFTDKVDYLTAIVETSSGRNSLSAEEQDQIRDQAWDFLVSQYALEPGFEAAGFRVGEAEQIDMVDGTYISPVVRSTFINPNTGAYDGTMLRQFVSNLSRDASGRAAMMWDYLKDQMTKQRLVLKYMALVAKGMYVTDLEVDQAVAGSNVASGISYIVENYDRIADSTVSVTKEDIRKYYDAHKNAFRQSASRDVEYVMFDVLPSEEDYAAAEKEVNEMAEEFSQSTTPMQYATLNSQAQTDKEYVGENQLSGPLAKYAFGPDNQKMYGPVKEGDTYTLARVVDTKMLPDSVGARHILLPAGQAELADSIVKALQGGASFAELAEVYSNDPGSKSKGGDLGVFAPSQMVPEFGDAVLANEKGKVFTVDSRFGTHIAEVTYLSKPTKKVQLATITYRIEPSQTTQQAVYANASKFIAEAHGSYENFDKAVASNSLSKRVARIRNTDRNLNGIDNSREIVRWAFNGEKGDVSAIMDIDGNYIVAAITGVTADGIAPVESVSKQIADILRLRKKGEMLSEELSGKGSLAETASKLETEVKEASGIEFNSFYIEGVGVEPKLIGAVTGVEESAQSKPVAGNAGVYLFDVTSRSAIETVTPESERVRLEANAQAYIIERANQALVDAIEITDNRVKFF